MQNTFRYRATFKNHSLPFKSDKKTNPLTGTSLIEQPDQFGGLDKFGGHDQRH